MSSKPSFKIILLLLLINFLSPNYINNTSFLNTNNNSKSLRILYLSDIHLDIFYDSNAKVENFLCKNLIYNRSEKIIFDPNPLLNNNDLGKFLCDTNFNLLNAILDKAKEEEKKGGLYDKIVILGDSFTHNLNKDIEYIIENYNKSIKHIKEEIKKRFPKTEILFTIGNNDFIERYDLPINLNDFKMQIERLEENLIYLPNSKEKLFKEIKIQIDEEEVRENILDHDVSVSSSSDNINSKIEYKPFTNNRVSTKIDIEINRTWYSYKLTDGIMMIFLDSVIWSEYTNLGNLQIPRRLAEQQFIFLENELTKAKKDNYKVVLNYHIPVHCNYYDNKINNNWKEKYASIFDDLIYKYKENIMIIFSSHLHMGAFAIRNKKNTNYAPVFHIPGISPSNNSNPGFSIIRINIDDTFNPNIDDISNYYLDLIISNLTKSISFKEFNIKTEFYLNSYDSDGFAKFLNKRDIDDEIFKLYINYTSGLTNRNNGDNVEYLEGTQIDLYSELRKYLMIKCSSYIISNNEIKEKCKYLD